MTVGTEPVRPRDFNGGQNTVSVGLFCRGDPVVV